MSRDIVDTLTVWAVGHVEGAARDQRGRVGRAHLSGFATGGADGRPSLSTSMFTPTLPLLHRAARDPSDRKSLSVVVTSNDQAPAAALPDTGVPASIAVGMTMAERHEWHRAHLAQGFRDTSDSGVRAAWCDLFDRHRVDLVLQGHNHLFERTDPIRAGTPTMVAADNSIVYPETDGTIHYTVGCAGRPRYSFQPGGPETYRGHELADTFVPNGYVWTAQGDKEPEAVGWSRVRYRDYAFIRVDVRPAVFLSEMHVVAVDEHGREFDKVNAGSRSAPEAQRLTR
jgi:hypothetical protein